MSQRHPSKAAIYKIVVAVVLLLGIRADCQRTTVLHFDEQKELGLSDDGVVKQTAIACFFFILC